MSFPLLPKSFFLRSDVVKISKDLLGKILVTQFNNQITAGKIVETEAYRAPDDQACHAKNNRRTPRTETMFLEGGIAYVYICYGIHHLFNVITAPENMAHAVLIRALEPLEGVEVMMERRGLKKAESKLTAGPGSLSVALGINKKHNGFSLISRKQQVWIEDRGIKVPDKNIIASTRVGVESAGESALLPWRFRIADSKWTSPAK